MMQEEKAEKQRTKKRQDSEINKVLPLQIVKKEDQKKITYNVKRVFYVVLMYWMSKQELSFLL